MASVAMDFTPVPRATLRPAVRIAATRRARNPFGFKLRARVRRGYWQCKCRVFSQKRVWNRRVFAP
jgi:hypothetical protein